MQVFPFGRNSFFERNWFRFWLIPDFSGSFPENSQQVCSKLHFSCPNEQFREKFYLKTSYCLGFLDSEQRISGPLALISRHVCQNFALRVYRNIWQISFGRKSYEQFRTFIEKSSDFPKKILDSCQNCILRALMNF